MLGRASRGFRTRAFFVGDSASDDDLIGELPALSDSDGRGKNGTLLVISPITDGVGVIGGGAALLGFRRFRGLGVAGGSIEVCCGLSSLTCSCSFVADEVDSLLERRVAIVTICMYNRENRRRLIQNGVAVMTGLTDVFSLSCNCDCLMKERLSDAETSPPASDARLGTRDFYLLRVCLFVFVCKKTTIFESHFRYGPFHRVSRHPRQSSLSSDYQDSHNGSTINPPQQTETVRKRN